MDARRNEVYRLRQAGKTYRAIAREVGVSKDTIRRDLHLHASGRVFRKAQQKLDGPNVRPFAKVDRRSL